MDQPIVERRRTDPARRTAWIGLLVALGISLFFVLKVLAPFWAVILLAVVAGALMRPSYRRLVALLNGRRRLAGIVVCLLLLVVLLVPLYLIALEVSDEALGIYELSTTQLTEGNLRQVLESRQDRIDQLNRFLEPVGFEVTIDQVYDLTATLGVRIGGFFYKLGVELAKHLLRFVFGFIFWVLIVYFILVEGPTFQAWFEGTLPLPVDEQRLVWQRFMEMASSLVVGNGLAALIQGLAGGLTFAALGLHGAVLWGVVMAILAFIPVVGISLIFIPFTIILLDRDGGDTQPVTLKVDPGSKTTGLALVADGLRGKRVVWAGELNHRGEAIKAGLLSRRQLRRGRLRLVFRCLVLALFLRKQHPLAVLASIDAENRVRRDGHLHRCPAKPRAELDSVVSEVQVLHRGQADVQNDLSVLYVLSRNHRLRMFGVDENVRSEVVIDEPVVDGPDEIGPAGGHDRISFSVSDRLRTKDSRRKRRFAYVFTAFAAVPVTSTPSDGRRHSSGPIEASTSVNSSLRKKGFAAKTAAVDARPSFSSFLALVAALPPPRIVST